jgi:hypothetical protein
MANASRTPEELAQQATMRSERARKGGLARSKKAGPDGMSKMAREMTNRVIPGVNSPRPLIHVEVVGEPVMPQVKTAPKSKKKEALSDSAAPAEIVAPAPAQAEQPVLCHHCNKPFSSPSRIASGPNGEPMHDGCLFAGMEAKAPEPFQGAAPPEGTHDRMIWDVQQMKAARETVKGYVAGLSNEHRAHMEADAIAESCGQARDSLDPRKGPNVEELAVKLLKLRLTAKLNLVHRIEGVRGTPKTQNAVITRIGASRLISALKLAKTKPGTRCIAASTVNPIAPIELHPVWPSRSNGLLIIDMKKELGADGWTDATGALTEESVIAFLLGMAQPPGHVA